MTAPSSPSCGAPVTPEWDDDVPAALPEGMTAERLRGIARVLYGTNNWTDTAIMVDRWADALDARPAAPTVGKCAECGRPAKGDEFATSRLCQRCLNPTLAAQLEGGGADDEAVPIPVPESSPDGEGQVVRRTRAEITDDFEEGTRTIRKWIAHGAVNGRHLCEELDAWLWYWGGAADGSSPVGSDPLSKVAAERDALAARLTAWPEVPDGHELWVVPCEVTDAVAGWSERGDYPDTSALGRSARAAVARRPKTEPPVERVNAVEALRTKRCAVWPGQDEIEPIVAITVETDVDGDEYLVVRSTYYTEPRLGFECPIDDDGKVECWVLAEDGES